MATYYVGPGGSDSQSGTSWSNRLLTIDAGMQAADSAGDTVYIGPGLYREWSISAPADGSLGNYTKIIGDPTGANTDGVGGPVVIVGSSDDETIQSTIFQFSDTRYIEIRNIIIRAYNGYGFFWVGATLGYINVYNCVFDGSAGSTSRGIYIDCSTTSISNIDISECVFLYNKTVGVYLESSSDIQNGVVSIENCVFIANASQSTCYGVHAFRVAGVNVRNCTFSGPYYAVRAVYTSFYTTNVSSCLFMNCRWAIYADTSDTITENYNGFYLCTNNYYGITTPGANDMTYAMSFSYPVLSPGIRDINYIPYSLSPWSAYANAGGFTTIDLYGKARSPISGTKSLGAVEYSPYDKETTTTYDSSAASFKLPEAGVKSFIVPCGPWDNTVTAMVYRESNYSGTLPSLTVFEPGSTSYLTDIDTGSAGQWNQLSISNVSSDVGWIVVYIQSSNTATSGSYAVFFDNIEVA